MTSRRTFLKTGATMAGGLMLSFYVMHKRKEGDVVENFTPNAFLTISTGNEITITLSKVEMGQGVWTALPMLIAEELDCDLAKVRVQHGRPLKEYFATIFPFQGTVGSTSVWSEFDRYRHAGATARAMLIAAAANRFSVSTEDCSTDDGFVVIGDRRVSYGELCSDAGKLPVPEVKLKDRKNWKVIGTSQKRLDTAAKISGKAIFGLDIQAPGLLTALLLRCPYFGGKAKGFDAAKANEVKGVHMVIETSRGIAILAENFWAAKKARDAIEVEWEYDEKIQIDSQRQVKEYRQVAATKGTAVEERGNVNDALSHSHEILECEYWFPYLAHALMEPLNCTVKLSGDQCEIWTGTQLQTADQAAAAKFLNIPAENVMIHTPFLGGGFGRRGSLDSDFVLEAVEVAKLSGKFVKLMWTREDDISGGYYRPSYLHRVQVGLNANKEPVAWEHRIVGQGAFALFPSQDPSDIAEGIKGSLYLKDIPACSIEVHITKANVPVLPWRAVESPHTCFVIETMIDELAFALKKDPIEFRIQALKDDPRYAAVLNKVAEQSGWYKPAQEGISRGVAVCASKKSTYVAFVVEASIENKKIRVHRVVCAVDCGLAVNPDGVRAQMEGSIVFGLTAALYGEITFENGKVKQKRFSDYKMMTMADSPIIEVHIVPGADTPAGVGEPGVPAVAPALANALFAATKKRLRRMPLTENTETARG